MISTVAIRKPKISSYDGLFSSLHVLTFPSKFKDKNEMGHAAANKVNGHFFYYGLPGEELFGIDIGQENNIMEIANNIQKSNFSDDEEEEEKEEEVDKEENQHVDVFSSKLYKDKRLFVEKCHFPAIYEDTLLCLSLWNLWHLIPTTIKPTLAFLYDHHLRTSFNYSVYSNQIVPDSFSFELLAQWAITYASHAKIFGKTSGVIALKEFILNIQNLSTEEDLKKLVISLKELQLPKYLNDFLTGVKVPYLVKGPSKKAFIEDQVETEQVSVNPNMILETDKDIEAEKIAELSEDLSSFIKFGTCHRPLNSAGWDVLFDMKIDDVDEIGYIECKLWSSPVGLPLIFPYYKKACATGIKFSILVAKKIQISLPSKFINSPAKPPTKGIQTKKRKTESVKGQGACKKEPNPNTPPIDYIREIEKLGNSDGFKLNLYCIRPEREKSSNSLTGKINFEIIKEFADATGVFILIESNFNPPDRSSKN